MANEDPQRGEAKRNGHDRVLRAKEREARGRDARELDEDDDELATVEEGLMALRDALDTQLRERPYVTLACAVGAGMLLGQALSTRAGRIAVLAAGGYAATRLLRSDGAGLLARALGEDVDDDDPDDLAREPRS